MTPADHAELMGRALMALNVPSIRLQITEIRFHCGRCTFTNMCDSLSMQRLLAWMIEHRFVGPHVQTMWGGVSPRDGFIVWCQR